MAAQYHSLFTTQGLALLREAIQNGTKLGITHMAYGDGNGIVPTPNADFTKLVKEVYRTPLNRLAPSKDNPNWLEADGVIPSAVGGFNIREVGLYAGNVLVAYANYPATYKPSADQGTAQIKTIRIVLQIDNTANFELKIDASVVMATIQTVEDAKIELYSKLMATIDSIQSLVNIDTSKIKSVYIKDMGNYIYDPLNSEINDGLFIINGWTLLKDNRAIVIENTIDLKNYNPTVDNIIVSTKRYKNGQEEKIRNYKFIKKSNLKNNNGTIIQCKNGVFKLIDDQDKVDWSDWGIVKNESYTSEEYFKPFEWGIENGYTEFNAVATGEVILTSAYSYSFSDDFSKSKISINMNAIHKHDYEWESGITNPILLYASNKVDLDLSIRINEKKLGRYPEQSKLVRAICIFGFNKVNTWLDLEDIYGYGFFATCNFLEVHSLKAENCDGQDTRVHSSTWDAYGDGLYVACKKAVIHNPEISTTQGGRAALVVEALEDNMNIDITINNPAFVGYDRGLHVETLFNSNIDVSINGGEIINCNTSILGFSPHGKITVTASKVKSRTDQQISKQANIDFTFGHFMVSGIDTKLITNECTFDQHLLPSQVVGQGCWESNNDIVLNNSKGFAFAWTSSIKITNLDGSKCTDDIYTSNTAGVKNLEINGLRWGGNLKLNNIDYSSYIKNVKMIKVHDHCGVLELINPLGCYVGDIHFDTPINYAIDNWWSKNNNILNLPVIENIVVENGNLFKYEVSLDQSPYRRSRPSFFRKNDTTIEVK